MSNNASYLSPLCSCIICRQVKSAKGIHSHYHLHNEERMNKHKQNSSNNHPKDQHPNSIKRKNSIIEYEKTPIKCVECNTPLLYDNKNNTFCSVSCSAKWSNRKRSESGWSQPQSQRESARQYNIANPQQRGKKFTKISQCVVCSKWFPGTKKTCSKTCFSIQQTINAKKHNLGSHGQRSGKILYRQDSYGKTIRLESSYEIRFANVLDSLNIQWTRPAYINWIDDRNNTRKYYPDFYLPDYDLYFDPKNTHQITIDRSKIQSVIKQNNIKLFIVPNDFINPEFVKSIVDQIGIEPIPEDFQSSVQTTYTTDRQLTLEETSP